MAASTVSIRATTSSRRRPTVSGDRSILAEPISSQVNDPDTGIYDKTGHSREQSHQSKDLVQIKKTTAVNSSVSPRRVRKVSMKKEKPRWLTVTSVLLKNLMLVLVLLGLVQMVRKIALKSGANSFLGKEMGLDEIQERVEEIESFLKSTAKMIQVQSEVVDRKIESEVGKLRNQMGKIEETSLSLGREMNKLVEKSAGLEKLIEEIRGRSGLSTDEFRKMYGELKEDKGMGVGQSNLDLDEIRVLAKDVMEKEIEKHAADGLAMADYALHSAGAVVVKHSKPHVVGKRKNWLMTNVLGGVHPDANKMLQPSFGEPGQCFPLNGSSGYAQIKLRTAIVPKAITLEHVAKTVAYDRSSAPKECRVSGWLQGGGGGSISSSSSGGNVDATIDSNKMLLLAEFTYDLEKSNAQTVAVVDSAASAIVDTVRLDFSSNHGSHAYTCIYRFRVHGHEPDSVSTMMPML